MAGAGMAGEKQVLNAEKEAIRNEVMKKKKKRDQQLRSLPPTSESGRRYQQRQRK